jgi:hypothetical protein
MRFETPLDNRIGQVLTMISLLTVAGLVVRDRKRAERATALEEASLIEA